MLRDWSAFHVLANTFAEGPVCLRIAGLTGAARALAVAELLQAHTPPALVLVESMTDAHHWTPRGGTVDVFSPSHASPARVEFFGDEIESIRLFDPTSQRSSTPLDELLVLPLVAQRDGSAPAGLTDYVPAAAPIVVDVPRVLDATREDAPASPPLREPTRGRQLVELSLVAGTSSAQVGALPEAVEV